jgi:hypothetical protein
MGVSVAMPSTAVLILKCLNAPVLPRTVLKFSIVEALTYVVGTVALGHAWAFPAPMGSIINVTITLSVAVPVLLVDVFTKDGLKALAKDKPTLKRLNLQLFPAFMSVVFLFIFSGCRGIFSGLSPAQQALAAPVWPIIKIAIKIAFKFMVQTALSKGQNPDFAV